MDELIQLIEMNRTNKLKTVSNRNESGREIELQNQHLPDCLSLFLSFLSLTSFVLGVIVPHQCVYAGQTPGVHVLVLTLLHVHVCFPRGW